MKRFFKDFIIYGFASILGKLAAVFLMPIYTNILTQEEYGAMMLITSVKGIIDLVSNLNIHSGIARDYREEGIDRTRLVSTGFYSILSISLSVMTIMLFSQSFWQEKVLSLGTEYSLAFTVMLLTIPAGSTLSYFAILTRYKKKPVLYSIGTIFQLIIQIFISIIGVVLFKYGIVSLFAGIFAGEIFGIIYFSYINRSNISLTFDIKYLKRALLFALPTLPAILAGWVDSSMGQILIGKYISTADLGVYSVALQLASAFTLISVALNNVWGPYLYENYKLDGFCDQVKRIFTVIVLILTIISASLSLMSKEIILLLSNPSYLEAAKYFTLLCIPMCIYLLFPIAASGISITRDTKYIGISYVIGSIMNVIFMLLLIPHISILAVPVSLGVSRVTTFLILYHVSKTKGVIDLPQKILVLLVFIVLFCYLIVHEDINLFYRISLTLIIDSIIVVLIFKKFDIKRKSIIN